MRTSIVTAAIILAASSQMGATGGGCEPPIIRDPGFDLWCGESLCTWKLVAGEIQKAPTWHSEDAGVAFVGSEASIEQTSPVDSSDGRCIKFDLVANVDDKAEMRLQADVYADGSIDLDERIPTSSWKPLTYNIRIDGAYRGIRFVLVKRGTGKATLAQIAATIADPAECDGFAAVTVAPGPIGARCDSDGDCASGLCRVVEDPSSFFGSAMTCVGCDPVAAACGAGDVCGIFEPSSFVRTIAPACVMAGGDEIGERCRLDGECASGICNGGVCSACDATRPCTSGSCRLAYDKGPTTCTAGAPGEPCAIDGDCTSGRCEGAERKQCDDGRGCSSPETCPVVEDGTLEPGACTLVGVLGGTCL